MHGNLLLKSMLVGIVFVVALTGAAPKEAGWPPNTDTSAESVGPPGVHAAASDGASLTADVALKYARWYASYRLIPVDPVVSAEQAADGVWNVTFCHGFVEEPDGGVSALPSHWILDVRITPDGRCWGEARSGARVESSPTERVEPGCIASEDSAILLARLYATRQGLIRSRTVVEQLEMEDGGWLVGFTPGVFLSAQGPDRSARNYPSSIIRVDPKGQCSVFLGPAEDERLTTGRPTENVKVELLGIETVPSKIAE